MKSKFYFFFLFFLTVCQELFAQAPTVATSNVSFSVIEGGSLRVNWTNGKDFLNI